MSGDYALVVRRLAEFKTTLATISANLKALNATDLARGFVADLQSRLQTSAAPEVTSSTASGSAPEVGWLVTATQITAGQATAALIIASFVMAIITFFGFCLRGWYTQTVSPVWPRLTILGYAIAALFWPIGLPVLVALSCHECSRPSAETEQRDLEKQAADFAVNLGLELSK